jgi:hypothetical protein
MMSAALQPSALLDPHGFEDGLLFTAALDALSTQEFRDIAASRPGGGRYCSPRHLLRHLVRTRLLPLFPWSSGMVMYQDPVGPPIRLWLHDDDGCPLRARAEEVRAASPVVLDESALRSAVELVYPLRTAAQVGLYEAVDLPQRDHEKTLALVAPFCSLEGDVLSLAAEIYAGSRSARPHVAVPGSGDVLDVTDRLFEAVSSARLLVR